MAILCGEAGEVSGREITERVMKLDGDLVLTGGCGNRLDLAWAIERERPSSDGYSVIMGAADESYLELEQERV